MEREAINEFVDNLVKERTVSKSDKDELKDVLEESAKLLDTDSLYDFLKHVKEGFEATGSNIFDENGLNMYSVKNITEKVVSEVKKERNRKVEIKQQEENEEKATVFRINEKQNYEEQEDKIEKLMASVDEYIEKYPQATYSEAIESMLKKEKIDNIIEELLTEGISQEEIFIEELKIRMIQNGFSSEEVIDYLNDIPILEDEKNPNFHGMNLIKLQMFSIGAKFISEENEITSWMLPNDDDSKLSKKDSEEESINDEIVEYSKQDNISNKMESSQQESESTPGKENQKVVFVSDTNEVKKLLKKYRNYNKILNDYEYNVQRTAQAKNEMIDFGIEKGIILEDFEKTIIDNVNAERGFLSMRRKVEQKKGIPESHSNPLLTTTNDKRDMILKMYFERGLSAVEISEKLRKAGKIPDNVKLPTADIIEVIVEETKRLGFKKEAIKLQKREKEIEELWELEKTYTEIQEKRKENFRHEIPDVAVKVKELREIRKIKDDEGSELRLDVLRKQNERRKQVEAAKGSLEEKFGLENKTEQRPQLRQIHIKGIAKGMKIKRIATSDLMTESSILKDLVREYNDNLHENPKEDEKDMCD